MVPGGDLSVNQNGDGYADGILQNTFRLQKPLDFGYWLFSGTSMAAPHVSGVAALLIAHGLVTPDDVRYAMESTAEDKGTAGWDTQYGWGIVDAYAVLNAPLSETRPYTLSDDQLMAFDTTYVVPPPTAALISKQDVTGFGVEYEFMLGGFGEVNVGLGSVSGKDLTGYSDYVLTVTNTSVDDFFATKLYIKTGLNTYETYWVNLGPEQAVDLALDLRGASDLNDVRELGFRLRVYIGTGFGLANAMRVKAQRTLPEWQ